MVDDVFQRTFGTYQSMDDIRYFPLQTQITPQRDLVAGGVYDFHITLHLGDSIEPGGVIKCAFPFTWSEAQTASPEAEGFVTVGDEGRFALDVTEWYPIERYINLTAQEHIPSGEKIVFYFNRVKIQNFPQHTWDNWRSNLGIWVDAVGNGEFLPVDKKDRYELDINAGKASQILARIPAITKMGGPFALKIAFLDAFNNPAQPSFEDTLTLTASADVENLPGEIEITAHNENSAVVGGLKVSAEGLFRITLVSSSGQLTGKTNFSLCTNDTETDGIFFGDIHAKTGITDGLGTPTDFFTHAQRYALSDFTAIADHNSHEAAKTYRLFTMEIPEEDWRTIVDAANTFNRPGEFVTIIAQEEECYPKGHRNIYYAEDNPSFFRGKSKPGWRDINEIFKQLKDTDCLVVPHHTLMEMEFDVHDAQLERLVEVYSMWGSSEYRDNPLWNKTQNGMSVRELLATGAKLGFIASSDNHNGMPDVSSFPSRFANICYQGGVACVFASELSRQNIYQGLKNRRTYATTGARIILFFHLNGHPMGEIVDQPVEKRRLVAKAIGMDIIEKIDVIKNGEEVFSQSFEEEIAQLEWTDTREKDEDYYYVRVTQKDGNIAWSSPIWVK